MRTKESESAEHFALALEVLNAVADHQAMVDGETRDGKMTISDLTHSVEAFHDLIAISPDLIAKATPSILAGFVAGLPRLGYRIVKA